MTYPEIGTVIGRERSRELVAAANRRRLVRQARDVARAARRVRRVLDDGSGAPGFPGLGRVQPRGVR